MTSQLDVTCGICGGNNHIEHACPCQPHIQRDHIDGPMLVMTDGRLHWLTLWERFCLLIGWHDARSLDRKHWNREP